MQTSKLHYDLFPASIYMEHGTLANPNREHDLAIKINDNVHDS